MSAKWRKILWRIGFLAAATLILAGLILPWALGPLIGRKLQALARDRLHADLSVRQIFYDPPYGAVLSGVTLIQRDGAGRQTQLLRIDRVDVKLARAPFGDGPLVFQRLRLRRPELLITRRDPAPDQPGSPASAPPPGPAAPQPQPPRRLSDMLRLRHVAVEQGRVEYQAAADAAPVVWHGINLDIKLSPQSVADYQFDLRADNGPLAKLSANGAMNVDSLEVEVASLALDVSVTRDTPAAELPPQVQTLLRRFAVQGRLATDLRGHVPLTRPRDATARGTVQLNDASAVLASGRLPLADVSLKLGVSLGPDGPTTAPAAGALHVAVEDLRARSGHATLELQGGDVAIDVARRRWELSKLLGQLRADQATAASADGPVASAVTDLALGGQMQFTAAASGPLSSPPDQPWWRAVDLEALIYPHALAVRPPGFPQRIEAIDGGPIRIERGAVQAEALAARYGADQWLLNRAQLPLSALPGVLDVQQIDAQIVFSATRPPYPAKLEKVVRFLGPQGTFSLAGTFQYDLQAQTNRTDYRLTVGTRDAAASLAGGRIPLDRMQGQAVWWNSGVKIEQFQAQCLGGRMTAAGVFSRGKPWTYDGQIVAQDVDLAALTARFQPPREGQTRPAARINGRGWGQAQVRGALVKDAVDSLRAEGVAGVRDAELSKDPIAKLITGHAKARDDAFTSSELAALFRIERQVIDLQQFVVNSPALGLQGNGKVSFAGRLDLHVLVAPLADWKMKLQDLKVPIVSDVAGELAGGIQKVLNTATGALLYEIHVTGTASDPRAQPVAAPVLTDAAAALFGDMLRQSERKDRPLADVLRDKAPPGR